MTISIWSLRSLLRTSYTALLSLPISYNESIVSYLEALDMCFRDPDSTKNACFAISSHVAQASPLHGPFLRPWWVLRSSHVTQVGGPQHFACISISKAVFSKVEAQVHDCDSWHHELKLGTRTKSKEVITSWTFGASETFQGWGVSYLINYIVSHLCHLVLTCDQRVYVIHCFVFLKKW